MPPPFPLGLSQMSLHAKMESAGGINFFLQRHGDVGGAWRVASLEANSHIHCRSVKDALTSLASLLASSFPSTANSSSHQSGVSHLSDFHETHWPKSVISGSRGVFSPSLSKVSGDPFRKEATVGFSSGISSKSEPLPWDLSSPFGILGSADWLGAGSSANLTWWCLLFCPSPLGLQQSLLLDLALDWDRAQVQWSLSISFSKVETVANAFWWASWTVVRVCPTELLFLLQGVPTPRGVGTSGTRLQCGFMHLVFLSMWMVWYLGHYFLPNGWLTWRGTRQPMQFIDF